MYKNITLLKNEYSKNYNNSFNLKMKSVSDEIFQTEQVFPSGYMPIGTYLKEKVTFSANREFQNHITTLTNEVEIDSTWDILSEYEKIIASHLLYGFYNAYIFSGGMGSGKTSTATHVLDFIKQKFSTPNSAFIKIAFDFNLGVLNEEVDNGQNIIDRFSQELYIKLKVAIHTYIKNHEKDLIRNLWRYAEDNNFEDFHEFFDLGNIVNDISWLDLSQLKKANEFIAFVELITDKISRIEMFMKFFKFLKTDLSENEFIIIFYDNIDILQPSLQKKIFQDYILPLNTIAKSKCLISLRRTTFLRTFDFRDVRFAHSFGYIHHHGHKVSDIIIQRLSYWKTNIDEHKIFKTLDQRYKDSLKKRISFLHKEFTSSQIHSLATYLDSLAGNCVRLGLYIANRLLINNIIKFDDTPTQRNRYKKSLIVSLETNTLLSNYEEVVNLYTFNEKFSLLPIRILHVISNCVTNDGIRIQEIVNKLSKFYDTDSITQSIKILLYSRRPLLWIDHIGSDDRLEEESSLFLSEIGHGYLNTLLDDLTYVQECFIVAKWNSDIIPVTIDIQNEYERLSSIIKCLRVAFDEDYTSLKNLGKESFHLITKRLIQKTVETIITLNLSAGYQQIFSDIEDLLTYLIAVKKVESAELEALLYKTQALRLA